MPAQGGQSHKRTCVGDSSRHCGPVPRLLVLQRANLLAGARSTPQGPQCFPLAAVCDVSATCIHQNNVALQGDMGDQPGLTLPFEPLSFIFQHVYYSVAASSVSQGLAVVAKVPVFVG